MPFEKGVSGNPEGRRLEQQGQKMWRDALRIAVEQIDPKTKKTRLMKIAEATAALAEAGDVQAAKEIGDRLDGKATQAFTGELTGKLTVVTGVPRADN